MASFTMGNYVQSGRSGFGQLADGHDRYARTLDLMRQRQLADQQYQISQNVMPNVADATYRRSVNDIMREELNNKELQNTMEGVIRMYMQGSGQTQNQWAGQPQMQQQTQQTQTQPAYNSSNYVGQQGTTSAIQPTAGQQTSGVGGLWDKYSVGYNPRLQYGG